MLNEKDVYSVRQIISEIHGIGNQMLNNLEEHYFLPKMPLEDRELITRALLLLEEYSPNLDEREE